MFLEHFVFLIDLIFSLLQYGISLGRLLENPDLSSFFKVLTTSSDGDNKVVNLCITDLESHKLFFRLFKEKELPFCDDNAKSLC